MTSISSDFLKNYIQQLGQLKVLPLEMSDVDIYLCLSNMIDEHGNTYQSVANYDAIMEGLNEDKTYPRRLTENLGLGEHDLLLRYQDRFYVLPQSTISNMGISFSVKCPMLYRLNLAQILKSGKMYYATVIIRNGIRTIIAMKKETPSIMTANKIKQKGMLDDIFNLSSYDLDETGARLYVQAGKYSQYTKVKKITIRNFENISQEELLKREKDGAIIILSKLNPTPSPNLLKNPQKFIYTYKYMKSFLTKEDKEAIPSTTMDADDLVEMLFDISKRKEYLDEKARRQLQKQLGELLSMI